MKATHFLTGFALVTLATACSNTADGARKDADIAAQKTKAVTDTVADKTKDAVATAGAAVNGAMKTVDVKAALIVDKRIDTSNINVDTDEAKKTVTLRGTVPSDAQKVIATEVATAKAPGYAVTNNLTIKAP